MQKEAQNLGRVFQDIAAEVFIDFTEEVNHAETNPKCSIH